MALLIIVRQQCRRLICNATLCLLYFLLHSFIQKMILVRQMLRLNSISGRQFFLLRIYKYVIEYPGSVKGQDGQGFEQPGPIEGVPAQGRGAGTR